MGSSIIKKLKTMETIQSISKWQDENGDDFKGEVIPNKKGILIISREMLLQADKETLKEIFSNFFPMDAQRHHDINYWDSIKYYGISEHFEEIEEACIAPAYEMWLKRDKNGKIKFEKMVKL